MAKLIEKPAVVQAAGNKPKRIEEFVGRVNTGTGASFSQLDLRLAKTFNFAKDLGIELYAEMFNVFNSKNPALYTATGTPSAWAGDPYQGEQRLLQLGARFFF